LFESRVCGALGRVASYSQFLEEV